MLIGNYLRSPLRMPVGKGGEGGGAGAGSGDNNSGATFDPKAFADTIMGEVNKTLNGFASSLKKDIGKLLEAKPKEGEGAGEGAGSGDGTGAGSGNNEPPKESKTIADLNARLNAIERENKTLKTDYENSKKATVEEKQKRLEAERVSAFDAVIADFPFAPGKARQQFKSAYLGQVVRDEDGNLIVQGEKGPMAFAEYLKTEFESSPHFQAATGQGGAGATAGRKPGQGQTIDVIGMSVEQLAKLPKEQRHAAMREAIAALPTQ